MGGGGGGGGGGGKPSNKNWSKHIREPELNKEGVKYCFYDVQLT